MADGQGEYKSKKLQTPTTKKLRASWGHPPWTAKFAQVLFDAYRTILETFRPIGYFCPEQTT